MYPNHLTFLKFLNLLNAYPAKDRAENWAYLTHGRRL
jgi:hypothetical protein